MIGKKSKYESHTKNKLEEGQKNKEIFRSDLEELSKSRENLSELQKSEEEKKEKDPEIKKSNGESEGKNELLSSEIKKIPLIFNKKQIKSDTDLLWEEICNGIDGKNGGIPMGFHRMDKYLSLRKSIYTLVGAGSGVGKTSIVDSMYVLNPYDWYQKNKNTSKLKFEVLYFSMERKKTYKLAKWLCLKIWKEEGILIKVDEVLSWITILDKKKQELCKYYIDTYLEEMLESGTIKIIDGSINPTGVYKYLYSNALSKGKEEQLNEYEKRYIPNDDNLITNVVIDHLGKTKLESIGGKYDRKLTIDKISEYLAWSRDYLHYSPIAISQFNRVSYSDIQQAKKNGLEPDPTPEYFKDTANTYEDCDVCFALFNPYKYNLLDYMDYNIKNFVDSNGNNRFRSLKILKNSYGTDDVRIGLGFLGEVSFFKEIPKANIISQYDYASIVDNSFFR